MKVNRNHKCHDCGADAGTWCDQPDDATRYVECPGRGRREGQRLAVAIMSAFGKARVLR